MTDKNIIKAMECCNTQNCADCPLYNGNSFSEKCKAICFKEMTSLINRQQAEIEELKVENKKLNLMVEAIDDYINPLPFKTDFDNAIENAKSEAYEEFAERLKSSILTKLSEKIQEQNPHLYLINTIITDLVKEMKRKGE